MGFTTWFGDFTGASGQLMLNPAQPSASTLTVTRADRQRIHHERHAGR